MPFITLSGTRREFLQRSASLLSGIVSLNYVDVTKYGVDPDFIALLSDTHIAADPKTVNLKTNMTDNLIKVRTELLDLPLLPNGTIVTGDCAFQTGAAGDYAALSNLMAPLAEAGHKLHYLMGNHDNRDNFKAGVKSIQKFAPLDGKFVTRFEVSKAIIVLLDSLNKTNSTEGVIGGEQMKWLSEALAMNKNKPTIIMVHHNPVFGGDVSGALVDTKALFDVIVPEKQVKMVIFGHTHRFEAKEHEGIHLLNLPPVAYPFNEKDPTGWVEMHLAKTGVDITLNALNKHAMNGKSMQFRWRV